MPTARSIIRGAFTELEVYDPAEQILDADAATALEILNDLVSRWGQEYLYLYTNSALALTLTSPTASYTIGLGGSPSFTFARPTRVDVGPGAASAVFSGTTYPVDIISQPEWDAVFSLTPGSGPPSKMFYDPQWPLGVINLSPAPDHNYVLNFNAWLRFLSFADLQTNYSLATSTSDTLKHNLAVAMREHFTETPLNPATIMLAQEEKEALRKTNILSRSMRRRHTNAVAESA